jgi:multicomponent Na+:H+ antiporter subunit B
MSKHEMPRKEGMDLVAKSVAGWLKGFILLFGIYLVLHSQETPGGGFAGGIIIACAFILHTLTEGQRVGLRLLSKKLAMNLGCAAALLFLGTAIAAACRRCSTVSAKSSLADFLDYYSLMFCDLALALVVSMLLYVVFAITAAVHVSVRNGQRRMFRNGR